jgi:putative copper resistance protein D
VFRLAVAVLLIAAIGLLLTVTLLRPPGHPAAATRAVARAGAWLLASAAIATVTHALLVSAQIAGVGPVSALDAGRWLDFVAGDPLGRALAVRGLLAALAAVLLARAASRPGAAPAVALLLALLALVTPVVVGHAPTLGAPGLARVALAAHVVAMAVWAGGLFGLIWTAARPGPAGSARAPSRADAVAAVLPRFSPVAAWCLAGVAGSGLVLAMLRLGGPAPLPASAYGRIVLIKAAVLAVLAGLGAWQRRRLAASPGRAAVMLLRVAVVEVTLMAVAASLAVALSTTPAPPRRLPPPVGGADLLGYALPPEPTAARLATGVLLDGVPLALLLAASVTYLVGVRTARRRGVGWRPAATACWFAGLLVAAWASVGGLGVYARVTMPAHVAAHLLLATAVPLLLLAGGAGTLARQTLPGRVWPTGPRLRVVAAAGRRVADPVIALPAFGVAVLGWYLPQVFPAVMARPLGHTAMQASALGAGLLLFARVGPRPSAVRRDESAAAGKEPVGEPVLVRAGVLAGVLVLCAAFSLALGTTSTLVGETYYRMLTVPYLRVLEDDQRLAGTLAWVAGGIPVILAATWALVRRGSARV